MRSKTKPQGYPGSMPRKKARLSPGLFLAILFLALLAILWYIMPLFSAADHIVSETPENIQNNIHSSENTATQEPLPTLVPAPQPTAVPFNFALLVNEQNPLPEDYDTTHFILLNTIETDLFIVKEADSYADSRAVDALSEMLTAAQSAGLGNWQISEAYRSVDTQQRIWNEKYEKYRTVNGLSEEKAREAVQRRVAAPGCSEHHTGLAFDLTVPGKSFADTPQSAWISAHCHEYGFIVRYQTEKERITGITAEPWHIRYVGQDAAVIMYQENLCLEEYAQKYQ